ncbi:MAG: hypothetical protein FWC76_08805 [Defluviitaleaceae bacterium]|nr:hypothetical protein [Defluviitaleaceae bacterium]
MSENKNCVNDASDIDVVTEKYYLSAINFFMERRPILYQNIRAMVEDMSEEQLAEEKRKIAELFDRKQA